MVLSTCFDHLGTFTSCDVIFKLYVYNVSQWFFKECHINDRGGTFWQSSNNNGILTRNVEYHNSYVYTEDLNNKKISDLLGLLIKLKYPYLNKITAWANENF